MIYSNLTKNRCVVFESGINRKKKEKWKKHSVWIQIQNKIQITKCINIIEKRASK